MNQSFIISEQAVLELVQYIWWIGSSLWFSWMSALKIMLEKWNSKDCVHFFLDSTIINSWIQKDI